MKRLKTVLIHEINHKYQEEQDTEFNDYDLENIYLTSRRLYNFLSKSENLDRVSEEDIEHFAYHLNENEIDSVVRELYAQAKRDKKPYIEVLRQYIRKMYSYDKEHIQENEIKDVYWVFYKELYRNMIKHAKKYLPSAQLKENNEKMNLKKIIKEEVKKSIREARPYHWMYPNKSSWFRKPIDFKKKYKDFNVFLEETKDEQIAMDWVSDRSNTWVNTPPFTLMPNQMKHLINKFSQYVSTQTKTIQQWLEWPLFTEEYLSPQEIYDQYEKVLSKKLEGTKSDKKTLNLLTQSLQFILEYEYKRWKAEKEKPDEQR